jgi:RimJ/RimL family protein N-acetyltransferase
VSRRDEARKPEIEATIMSLVTLRPLALTDVDQMMTWVNDPGIVGNFATFSGKPFTREEELAYVEKMLASPVDKVFAIAEAATGSYLGNVGIHQIHWPSRVGRLACIVGARREMGKGYGSAAIAAALDWAFREAKLHKVWLMCFRENLRAQRTYARLGFVAEGLLREEYFHQDGWHDMVRMAMLDREWEQHRAPWA